MKLQHVFDQLETNNPFTDIFSEGPANKIESAERLYLDDTDLKGKPLFKHLMQSITEEIEDLFEDGFYVCLTAPLEEDVEGFPTRVRKDIQECGFELPADKVYKRLYLDDEDRFMHYFLFEDTHSNLKRYIELSISHHIPEMDSPYWPCQIYLIDKDLSVLVNIYDDRGMDIVDLEP